MNTYQMALDYLTRTRAMSQYASLRALQDAEITERADVIAALEAKIAQGVEPVNAWTAVGDGLPDIGTPVMAMCGITKPEMYPMMRGDDCDGWLWEAHRSGPIDDPRSYEADDDYEVVAWKPLPKPPGATT